MVTSYTSVTITTSQRLSQTMEKNRDWVQRNPRYRFAERYSATICRTSESGPETIPADLLDMSRCGLKLSIPTQLEVHEVIQLHLVNDELGLNLIESAQIRWVREKAETGTWDVGCEIQRGIDENVLEELAERGLLDRRDSARHNVTAEGLAQWELSEDSVPVQLLNLSTEGFCLASDQATNVGSRLKLTLIDDDGQSQVEILARSRWQHEFENGYLIGCELAMDDVFDLVGYFADSPQPSVENDGRWLRLSLLSGAAILAIVATLSISWIIF